MAYDYFDESTPEATQTGPQICDSVRENMAALRDAVITTGMIYGWDAEAQDTGEVTPPADPTQPDQIMYDKGTERVKAAMTWSSDLVTAMVVSYSADSGVSWDVIGTCTITYDGSDNYLSHAWS